LNVSSLVEDDRSEHFYGKRIMKNGSMGRKEKNAD
jgi:hypothetical protein